ncbi:hypothetical protein E2C01_097818 [Portunus trituberculatus]|uniref:Uncharacterized protein n=1 Tax=Portunus trituberculatus TaxID=210409 RepID=A0A5B7K5T3_PORTR|nr:hypothetical protein [Portunus trituberculatus]
MSSLTQPVGVHAGMSGYVCLRLVRCVTNIQKCGRCVEVCSGAVMCVAGVGEGAGALVRAGPEARQGSCVVGRLVNKGQVGTKVPLLPNGVAIISVSPPAPRRPPSGNRCEVTPASPLTCWLVCGWRRFLYRFAAKGRDLLAAAVLPAIPCHPLLATHPSLLK